MKTWFWHHLISSNLHQIFWQMFWHIFWQNLLAYQCSGILKKNYLNFDEIWWQIAGILSENMVSSGISSNLLAFYLAYLHHLAYLLALYVAYLLAWILAVEVRQGKKWLRSGREHWAWMVVVEVRQGTLWGPANTGRGWSWLRSGKTGRGWSFEVRCGSRNLKSITWQKKWTLMKFDENMVFHQISSKFIKKNQGFEKRNELWWNLMKIWFFIKFHQISSRFIKVHQNSSKLNSFEKMQQPVIETRFRFATPWKSWN